jgi:hypothetical protein
MLPVYASDNTTDILAKLAAADRHLDVALTGVGKLKPVAENSTWRSMTIEKLKRTCFSICPVNDRVALSLRFPWFYLEPSTITSATTLFRIDCDHRASDGGSNGRVMQFPTLTTVIRRMITSMRGLHAPRQITIEICRNVCHPLL